MAFLLKPAFFALDPEAAHRAAIAGLRIWGAMGTPFHSTMDQKLAVTVAGIRFPNPVGLAAGFDKNAEAIAGLFGLGFGSVEVGTFTPRPQSGNPRPRLFRLTQDEAVINRMGFNNQGIYEGMRRVARAERRDRVIGVNVGANKDSDDRIADYVLGVQRAAAHASYITINVSSPNTPGLRDLQTRPALDELLAACNAARILPGVRCPLFLKVAPDLDRIGIDDVARAAIKHRVDALIVANTTVSRPAGLRSRFAAEAGGLSGAPLRELARAKLAEAREATGGQLPLISVGGIDSADEARRRLDAGASLVQLYSAMVFKGPGLVRAILRGLGQPS